MNNSIDQRRLEIAQRIRKARSSSGMTQEEAAKILGFSRIKMNRIENGLAELSVLELDAFTKQVGYPVDYFFN